jgi:hypothetical protein
MEDATTTIISIIAQPRDAFAVIVGIFTISTGVVLAVAASTAFIIQRARYFREIGPDLRVVDARVEISSSGSGPNSQVPSMEIYYSLQNVSPNRAFIETTYVQLDVYGMPGERFEIDVDSLTDLDQAVVLPDAKTTKSVVLLEDESRVSKSFKEAAPSIDPTRLRFHASVSINYASDSELLLRVLNFGRRSRNTYARDAGFSWTLRRDSRGEVVTADISNIDNE